MNIFVKPNVVSQIIYMEMYLVDFMNATIYIQIKTVQVKDAIFMLIVRLLLLSIVFVIFKSNHFGKHMENNFIVNWHTNIWKFVW